MGAIVIDPKRVPLYLQSENSHDRSFLTIILHEIGHILGISSVIFPKWNDPSKHSPYNSDLPLKRYSAYGQSFLILSMHLLKKWGQNRYGLEEFAKGVPAGYVIEDSGGKGTTGSHRKNVRLASSTQLRRGSCYPLRE